jgi:hypothetical protein
MNEQHQKEIDLMAAEIIKKIQGCRLFGELVDTTNTNQMIVATNASALLMTIKKHEHDMDILAGK